MKYHTVNKLKKIKTNYIFVWDMALVLQNFATKADECTFPTTWKTTFNDCFWQQDYYKLSITKYIYFCVEMKKEVLQILSHLQITLDENTYMLHILEKTCNCSKSQLKMQQLQKTAIYMIITVFNVWMYQVSKNYSSHFLLFILTMNRLHLLRKKGQGPML